MMGKIQARIIRTRTTSKRLLEQYGYRGFTKAVMNKLRGRTLLDGIETFAKTTESVNQTSELQQLFFKNALSVWERQQHELTMEEQKMEILSLETKPLISIVMPIYNAPMKWFKLAVESLQAQSYQNWELVAVDDGSRDKRAVSLLIKEGKSDARLRIIEAEKNGGISKASNLAVAHAKGKFIALMDQDDILSPDALFWMVKSINQYPQAKLLYSDECKIQPTENVEPCDFIIKPDWSPELLYSYMYTGHLSVYKKSIIEQIGGFRSEYDFSQDYDLALRIAEYTDQIIHVERILYCWRMLPTSGAAGGKDFARISNLKALTDAFARKEISGKAEMHPLENRFHVALKYNPLVSIVIPSDSINMLKMCIDKLVGEQTSYQNIEIIAVANSKTCDEVEEMYEYVPCVKTCHYDKIYNFSDKCNAGAKLANGEYIVIYNDDVYPFSCNWIEGLLEAMQYPGVGGVSPMTVYENGTIQYAGMITGVPNLIGTAFNGLPENLIESNAMNHFLLRDVSVLCGACMMVRTDLYRAINGFDAVHTPTGHSDVDISFKIREKGMRCVFTPTVKLVHIGNHSWENKKTIDKSTIYCLKRWGKYVSTDPYFTDTMKQIFYRDVIYQYKIYLPDHQILNSESGKDILLVTHELTRTGAPIVLKNAVRFFLERGDYPVIISPVDGPMRQEFLDMGIPVIIDEAASNGHWSFEHFARNFDLIIVNTIAASNAIRVLSDSLPPVIWWIHEGKVAFDTFKGILPQKIGKNIYIYAVSAYTQSVMKKYYPKANGRLMFGVDDCKKIVEHSTKKQKHFIVVGTVEKRKGQDIAIQAFELLPKEEQEQSKLLIIGRNAEQAMMDYVIEASKKNKRIKYLGAIPHEEVLQMYAQSCALLIPSRDDPVPTTAAEAMSLLLPCVVSDQTGIASYITDGENGYIFSINDPNALSDKMLYILQNPQVAEKVGKHGRKIYEESFTYEKFVHNFGAIIDFAMHNVARNESANIC